MKIKRIFQNMITCQQCGAGVTDTTGYCSNCGYYNKL